MSDDEQHVIRTGKKAAHNPPDEPTFILRAQDKIAPEIVREWAYRAAVEGAPREKIETARKIADAMEDWQIEHHRKVPD